MSGLAISIPKTCFYFSGLTEHEVNHITNQTGIKHGNLPIRYIGLPLCTKKLTALDCAPLVERIRGRLNSWSTKTLSFAGRLQLLNSVIAGITNFWTSTFILPKKCIKIIESLCGAFLWKGKTEGHHSARVAWSSINLPKENGGLGIKNLYLWNKAAVLKLIWMIFFNGGSIWVAWFIKEVLGGHLADFWTVRTKQKNSWLANKIINLRHEVYPWIKVKLGNGEKCRFWTDNWSSLGRIDQFLSPEGPRQTGIPSSATVSSLWYNGNWVLPPARSEKQVIVQATLSSISLTTEVDSHTWWMDDQSKNGHSTGLIYAAISPQIPHLTWTSLIWHSGIPKHNFLAWLVTLNRCPTRDRLLTWGLLSSPLCLLCGSGLESRDHIFFDCQVSWNIWSSVSRKCRFRGAREWETNLLALQNLVASKSRRTLILIAWKACIYSLWTERNGRLHRGTYKSEVQLLRDLDSTVRNKASSMRDNQPRLASSMIQAWFAGSFN